MVLVATACSLTGRHEAVPQAGLRHDSVCPLSPVLDGVWDSSLLLQLNHRLIPCHVPQSAKYGVYMTSAPQPS